MFNSIQAPEGPWWDNIIMALMSHGWSVATLDGVHTHISVTVWYHKSSCNKNDQNVLKLVG